MHANVPIKPEPTILLQAGSLTLTVSTQADEQAIALLQQTTYGTEGIRYRQTGQGDKIFQLHDPYFFQLYQHHELIGFYCLDKRRVGFPDRSITGYYGRYLAVREDCQGQGYGQLLKSIGVDYMDRSGPSSHLFYSYIEAKNTRSMKASQKANFVSVAQLKTYMFRRFSPKADARFRLASVDDPHHTVGLVHRHFAQYGFQHFSHINYQNHYFTLEENGRIVAGVQANPIVWTFVHLPGKLGPFIRRIAPSVPGLRRFFNPAHQSFVVLEGVYMDENRPDLLPILLESVLAYFGLHTAMWQIDQKDPMMALLKGPGMGLLSHFQPNVTTHVMAKAVGLPDTVEFGKYPAYVSCFDYS